MTQLLFTSLIMSGFILLVLVHKKFLGKKYSSKLHYFLWLIIAIRLILPYDLSLENMRILVPNPVNKSEENLVENTYTPAKTLENDRMIKESPKIDNNDTIIKNETPSTTKRNSLQFNEKLIENIFYIWLIGASVYFIFNFISYIIYKNNLERSYEDVSTEVEEKFKTLKSSIAPKGKLEIKKSRDLTSPMIIGLIKSTLVLPSSLEEKNLDYIISHELVHFKRRDLIYKFIIFLATAIHWFNPLVYLMEKIAYEDIELSCDEIVVKNFEESKRIEYSKNLLNAISLNYKSPIFTTHFGGGKKLIMKRLDKIMDTIKRKPGKSLTLLLALLVISSTLFLGCSNYKNVSKYTKDLYKNKTFLTKGINSRMYNIIYRLQYDLYSLGYISGFASSSSEKAENKEMIYGFIGDVNQGNIEDLSYFAAIYFSLVENCDKLTIYISELNESPPYYGEPKLFGSVERKNIDTVTKDLLGKTTEELGNSLESFNKIVQAKDKFYENIDLPVNLSIYDSKTKYVGDNSKVGAIVNQLDIPEDYTWDGMKILSENEPYGLELNYKYEGTDANLNDFNYEYNSAILFALIENLDKISFKISDNNSAMEVQDISRKDIDKYTKNLLNLTTKEIGKNKEDFNFLLSLRSLLKRTQLQAEEFYSRLQNRSIPEMVKENINILESKGNKLAENLDFNKINGEFPDFTGKEENLKYYKIIEELSKEKEYSDILYAGKNSLDYVIKEFENGNVKDDLKGELYKYIAIALDPRGRQDYKVYDLTPNEWYKNADIRTYIKIENDKQVFEDQYEQMVYEYYYNLHLSKGKLSGNDYTFNTIQVYVPGIYESGDILKIYAEVMRYEVLFDDKNEYEKVSGAESKACLIFKKNADGYELVEVLEALDGSEMGPSLKKMTADKPEIYDELITFHFEAGKEEEIIKEILKQNGYDNVKRKENTY